MTSKIIEVTNGERNWGKFLLLRPDVEWLHPSSVSPTTRSLLHYCGWTPDHIWVLDLQTGEGACFRPGGYAKADLEKHRIWVCPMFEPFLEWLYEEHLAEIDLESLPSHINLPAAPFADSGYRRKGPQE